MFIRLLRPRVGRDIGSVFDAADGLGQSLIDYGDAERVEQPPAAEIKPTPRLDRPAAIVPKVTKPRK